MKSDEDLEYCKLIGMAIRRLRVKVSKKSVRIFAYENDIPRSTLSRIETGQNEAQLLSLKKIAEGFEWNLSELFYNIEKEITEIKSE